MRPVSQRGYLWRSTGLQPAMPNALYYSYNLVVIRESIADDSVDLIYLDPPFNSNASYNVLFNAPSGEQPQAPIKTFEGTRHWNETAERVFDEAVTPTRRSCSRR